VTDRLGRLLLAQSDQLLEVGGRIVRSARIARVRDPHLGALFIFRTMADITRVCTMSREALDAHFAAKGLTREALFGLPPGTLPTPPRQRYQSLDAAFRWIRGLEACDGAATSGAVMDARLREQLRGEGGA
jgi:hypothetical protein